PLWYGVGRLLVRRFGAAKVRVLPHVSAFQLAAARLGWALEEVVSLSVHGRPLAGVVRHLAPGRRLLVPADDGGTRAGGAARAAGGRANAARLGVPQLEVVKGEAPGCLGGLPEPDAVFVGGGVGTAGLLDACWERLRPGGRLVANAVTLAGEAAVLAFHAGKG